MADSEGMVSMLVKPVGWQWMPVYDIHAHRKSADVSYWPIMVSGHNFTFIMLNGESQPAIWPKPAETTRELRLPVALSGKGKDFKSADDQAHNFLYTQALAGHAERMKNECYVTGERNHDEVDEEAMEAVQMQADKMVLVMLQTTLKAGQNSKAKDLCHKLRTDKGSAAASPWVTNLAALRYRSFSRAFRISVWSKRRYKRRSMSPSQCMARR